MVDLGLLGLLGFVVVVVFDIDLCGCLHQPPAAEMFVFGEGGGKGRWLIRWIGKLNLLSINKTLPSGGSYKMDIYNKRKRERKKK